VIGQSGMAKAYSYDLRQKVMQAIELDGMKKSETSELFNISRNTIHLWFQRKADTGDIQVKPRPTASPKQKITDWEKFRAFVKEKEKPRRRWLNCGKTMSVVALFLEHYKS
jgi:transposase